MEPGGKMNIEIKIPYATRMAPPHVEYSVQAPGHDAIHGSAPVTVRSPDGTLVDSSSYVTHTDPGGYTVEVNPSSSHSTYRKETRRYVTTTPAETVTRRYVTSQPTETVTRRHIVTQQPSETVTRRYVTSSPAETITRRYVSSEPENVTRRTWVTSSQPQETIITGGNIHVTPTTPISIPQQQGQDPVNQYTKTTTTTVTTREVDSSETGSVQNTGSPTSSTIITSQPTQINRQSSRVEVDENRFQVTLDVSQYRPEDIEVKVDNNKLTVRAESKGKRGDFGSEEKEFFRQYTLPDDVDAQQVRSYYSEDGNLTLEAPRIPRQSGGHPAAQMSFHEPPRPSSQPAPRMTQGHYTFHQAGSGDVGGERSVPITMRIGTPNPSGKTVPIVEEVYSNYGSDMESNRSFRK